MPSLLTIFDFLLGGLIIALLTYSNTQKPYQRLILRFSAAFILTTNLIAIAALIWSGPSLIAATHSAPIAPATALNFLLFAVAISIGKSPATGHISALLLLVGLITTSVALVGYAFDVSAIRRAVAFESWSMPTTICFALLFCAALLARPQLGWTARLIGKDSGGVAARRLLPAILAVPVILSWLVQFNVRNGVFDSAFGLAVSTVATVVVLAFVVYLTSVWLARRDVEMTDQLLLHRTTQGLLLTQSERFDLLNRITKAIGERLDISSIYQVVISALEDQLPIDFICIGLYDTTKKFITIPNIGSKALPIARELELRAPTRITVDGGGLSDCTNGKLAYEPDAAKSIYPFTERLAKAELRSVIMAPMMISNEIFGVLILARKEVDSFSDTDCEFVGYLAQHIAVAAHQSQLLHNLQGAYDDMRDAQKSVMQHERLRALGQMSSGITHDINNAISPISIQTQSILEFEKDLSEPITNYLHMVNRQINDVAATVGRLREFYRERESAADLTPVDLNALAAEVIDLSEARWKDMARRDGITITIESQFSPKPAIIMGKDNELREVMVNLIFNAADAMPEGGIITIRTNIIEDTFLLSDTPPSNFATLEISDSGIGMDEATILHCMEPFFTTKGERGTGLGLAMVHGILKRHDATINITSAPRKGTTFTLTFPLPDAMEIPEFKLKAQRKPDPMRLLMIDDDPYVLETLVSVLELDEHNVTSTTDPREGLKLFKKALEDGQPFDAAISDLGMPYLDGNQVTLAIREMSASTPVILLTGWGQNRGGDRNNENKADFVLGKPPNLPKLREILIRCQQAKQRQN